MKIEIYRIRNVLGYSDVMDDLPERIIRNVSWAEIRGNWISANINGEEMTIRMDKYNYRYFISEGD